MKLIDNILYLELSEMVECGVSEKYLWKAKSTGTKCWFFTQDPTDKRKVLVGYEDLKDNYKKMVMDRFGNPYELVARQPILRMILQDYKANEYYQQYRYNGNTYLPIKRVNEYTRAASWLNMIHDASQDHKAVIKTLGLKAVPDFYNHCKELIKIEISNSKSDTYTGLQVLPGDFPSTYQRLMEKAKKFKADGYDYLIDAAYGNKNAAKLGKSADGFDPELERKQIGVIRFLATKHNNFDAAQIEILAKGVFLANGWECIGRSRIYQILQEMKPTITPGRQGRRKYNSTIQMQVKREAPKFPTTYFTLDGWTAELLYQYSNVDGKGRKSQRYDGRLVIVVVLDAMNKYPVGYAIGERETPELIRQANRNALVHLKELFGAQYMPFQLQSDNYSIKTLTPFYQAMTQVFTPAKVGNSKAKVIEPYFNHLNKTYCQLMPNWSGFGLDRNRDNQVNTEYLDKTKHTFPDKEGVIRQLEMIITKERQGKIEEYMQRWEEMPVEEKLIMPQVKWLEVFGQPVGKTNMITGQGIIKVINGQEITYDCFDPSFRDLLHIDWQIVADLEDLTHVLAVSPDGRQKYVLEQKMTLPMDLRSTTPEHREYRQRIDQFNKAKEQQIIQTYAEDAEIVEELVMAGPLQLEDRHEAALKLMFTTKGQQKEGLQDAKGLKRADQKLIETEQKTSSDAWAASQAEFLHSKIDINQYLNND